MSEPAATAVMPADGPSQPLLRPSINPPTDQDAFGELGPILAGMLLLWVVIICAVATTI